VATRLIKPFAPISPKVAPLRPGEDAFRLADGEIQLFDGFAQEVNGIAGIDIEFFSLSLKKSKRDPLYDEPTERVWSKPYKFRAWIAAPSQTPVVGEEGFRVHFDASAWLARKDLEDVQAPNPNEGDVIHFWNTPFFNNQAGAKETVPKAGFYFDVIQVTPDGHLHDTPSFVGFRCLLKRRSEFGAERKISPP